MIRHSALFYFVLLSTAFVSLAADATCEDDPTIDCNSLKDDCATEKLIPLFTKLCPVTCDLCPSTASPTTPVPCMDDPKADCAAVKDVCSNEKYATMLKEVCPVTCNMCPGATTVPPTANPNCYDSATNCKNWAKNGFCTNSFYKCTDRLNYCAKTCGLCTAGACKDSN